MKQKFIGTKTVMAEPMTAEVAIKKGYRVNGNTDGYEVEYEDGYKSWSPADAFNKAYKPAETPLDRLRIERDELAVRLDKLKRTLEEHPYISINQRHLMKFQYGTMIVYHDILDDRIMDLQTLYPYDR